ncbi:phosphoribosyl pyrophosphate transferase [Rhodococcus phage Weasels2]|uniref:ribose-phosphate diphosphokinase n=1 Tax=Rhodococcus phage Weasels2 TaxID=1897437 RepID=A0A1I9SAE3_9CAUD|nr:ribose-phosphate pyrophosphokinase [Rhodococcus phage Weasels2]AOZ63749.1 phosphoribosyl pyrophosphate transferase [Rhodococcus phage Weasels2]
MIELYTKVGNRVFLIDEDPFMKFPGGELHMKAEPKTFGGKEIAWVSGTDVEDYIKLAMWSDMVYDQGGEAHAIIPYLPAARADRGTPNGSAIYSELIAITRNLSTLSYVDAHSSVMPNYLKLKMPGVVHRHFTSDAFLSHGSSCIRSTQFGSFKDINIDAVISPDKGATERAILWAEKFNAPLVQAGKTRDPKTGSLSGFECDDLPFTSHDKNYLIVDDICDGGGTFNGLVDYLGSRERKGLDSKFYLFTTHGIYSKGLDELKNRFAGIWTTDSLEKKSNDVGILKIKTKLLESI